MPPEPDPADAALRDAADALARRVRDRLPAAQAHGRAEIAALPLPLARVLLARLDARVDREAPTPASDWLDADRARDAARAWRDAARQAARVPAPAWASFLADGCLLALSHVVRPAETLAAVAFEDDGPDERPAVLLVARIAAVSSASFLPEIAGRYIERKGLTRMDRPALESLLRRIDRRMAESFTAAEWADAVTPLSVLAGPDGVPYALTVALFEAKGQPEMARAFAGRGRQSDAEIRDLLASLLPSAPPPPDAPPTDDGLPDDDQTDDDRTDDSWTDDARPTAEADPRDDARSPAETLDSWDVPADAPNVHGMPPATPVPESPSVAEIQETELVPDLQFDRPGTVVLPAELHTTSPLVTGPEGRGEGASTAPPPQVRAASPVADAWLALHDDADPPGGGPIVPSETTPAPEPTDDTPLWQRYAPTPDAGPDAAPALWKRFIPRPAGAPDAHLPSPPVAPPRAPLPPAPPPGPADARPPDARPPDARPTTSEDALSGLDRLERAALGHPADAARRALYIADLFGSSEADYGKTLVALARDASWTEASDTIARDIFRRHRVSPLSDAAVAFVDDVESRFRPA